MERVNVMQQPWDYLIILDACRYDYFEEVWQNYLQGDLKKIISIGSSTKEWRNKSFAGYYDDVIYISANPYINSLTAVKGFLGREHFFKVYDLWLDDWDKQKGTVLPETVTKRAIEIIKTHPDKRVLIHYIQPHEPYLGSTVTGPGFEPPTAGGYLQGVNRGQLKSQAIIKMMKILSGVLYWTGIRGNFLIWKLRELMRMPPAGPMDAVRRKYGKEVLRKAYKENLEIVLEHIAELVNGLTGRIVITADHGEMLGEDNCYCHWSRNLNKILVEVPWLIIDKGIKAAELAERTADEEKDKAQPSAFIDKEVSEETKRKIQDKLRALGYHD